MPSLMATRCFFTAASVLEINPMLYKKLSYDPDRDFRVLGIVSDLPMIMIVHPSVPAKTLAEFVAYASRIPASSISARLAPAASVISRARCSSRRPAPR